MHTMDTNELSFNYFAPKNVRSALEIWEKYGSDARYMAGGTDLLVRIKSGRVAPRAVIDIKNICELAGRIEENGNFYEIGALTLMADIQYSARLNELYPALVEAASSVGSVQIRNRATLAGNICNASPAADTAPALLIYKAWVSVTGPSGLRVLPLDQFIVGPGKTALLPGELVESLLIPLPTEKQAAAFERLTRRKGVDLATINVCAQVTETGVTRVAVGAAGPVPFVVNDESGLLADPAASKESKQRLLREMMLKASPISDVRASQEYRQAMLAVLAGRALERAISRYNA